MRAFSQNSCGEFWILVLLRGRLLSSLAFIWMATSHDWLKSGEGTILNISHPTLQFRDTVGIFVATSNNCNCSKQTCCLRASMGPQMTQLDHTLPMALSSLNSLQEEKMANSELGRRNFKMPIMDSYSNICCLISSEKMQQVKDLKNCRPQMVSSQYSQPSPVTISFHRSTVLLGFGVRLQVCQCLTKRGTS